jgi:hypothetical protein
MIESFVALPRSGDCGREVADECWLPRELDEALWAQCGIGCLRGRCVRDVFAG